MAGYNGANYQHHAANGSSPDVVIIDDTHTDTSVTGTWSSSTSVAGYEGSNYRHHIAGVGDNSFTWGLASLNPGDYLIYAKWTAHTNRASNATYSINHANGTAQISVDQRQNGGQWVLLGTYTLDTASAVVLTDQADGYVIADAIQAVPVGATANTATWSPALQEPGNYQVYASWTAHPNRASNATYTVSHTTGSTDISIDQRQNGGQWVLLGSFDLDSNSTVSLTDQADGYVIADAIKFVAPDSGYNSISWSLPVTGQHEVFARWTSHPNRASNATYTVTHATGSTDISLDQRQNGASWVSLGTYTLDTNSEVVLTDQADGYVIADAIMVTNNSSEGTYFIHTDHLGTPRRVTDTNQILVWRWDSTPFGTGKPNEDPDGDGKTLTLNQRFPGQYYDQETGLHYNYFRYYDAETGRYITSDPIGLAGGLNTFGYTYQNPLTFVDPLGLCTLNPNVKRCLEKVLGGNLDDIKIKKRFGKKYLTTRKNRIYLPIGFSCSAFQNNPGLLLHEFFHVLRQWNTGVLSRTRYGREAIRNGLGNSNKYEKPANDFARNNKEEYLKCLGDCK